MRKLLLLSAVLLVVGPAAPASAAESSGPVVAPGFAASFPALLPVEETAKSDPPASGALGPDGRVLLAATFWLLLAGLAISRRGRQPEQDPTPITGWVLGYAPPLPR